MRYHLIAIGGVGMSGMAQILHESGETVTGSDRQESDNTRRLRAAGVKVYIGHAAENLGDPDIVVYSAAIPEDNPERVEARRRGIECIERCEMLGRMMTPYKHRIAIAGTHGKTTTTSMISSVFDQADVDASILIGGDVKHMGGNARLGDGSIVLTEACEAFGTFLHLHPSVAVITNIDADHLDYYGTIEGIEAGFKQFVSQVDEDGVVIACWDDPRVRAVLDNCGRRVVTYGMEGRPDFLADRVDTSTPGAVYALVYKGESMGRIELGVPGEQNVLDSLAAVAVAFELGVRFEAVQSALKSFHGAGRRFEILYDGGGVLVVDDYAHHPVEISATLKGARAAYADKKITAVFQPHLYSRTKAFLDDFADALRLADEVVVTPIYAAREQPMEGVTAESIVARMKDKGFANVRYAADKDSLAREIGEQARSGDMVIVLGAGDIRIVGEQIASMLSQRGASE